MNKKEKIAAYIEAYNEVFKGFCNLPECINDNSVARITDIYDNLFKFVLDIKEDEKIGELADLIPEEELTEDICNYHLLVEPHTKREKVEKYIDLISAADTKINELNRYINMQVIEDVLKPYWELEKNILDIPEEQKELIFYYLANEIGLRKRYLI